MSSRNLEAILIELEDVENLIKTEENLKPIYLKLKIALINEKSAIESKQAAEKSLRELGWFISFRIYNLF